MSTNLSSNSLFHFTNSFKNLTSILTNGLFPRYVVEDYSVLDSDIPRLAIPMICFCDIPLTHILDHIDEYGKYGIGLSKEWGEVKDINPVAYLTTNAKIRKYYDDLLMKSSDENGFSDLAFEIIKYIKPYRGESRKGDSKVFYNEKEWRHIFRGNNTDGFKDKLLETEFDEIKDHNFSLEPYPLKFSPENIRYLIVEKREDVFSLCEFILESTPFKKQDKYKLMSCIISIEDIREDF